MVRIAFVAVAFAVAVLLAAAPARSAPREFRIDPERTVVTFSVRGGLGQVGGRLPRAEGVVTHDPDRREAARVDATVPLAGLQTGDAARDRWLKGPEWFDAARNPLLRFVSASARDDGGAAVIRGELTLRGVTRPVELVSTARDADARTLRFTAEAEIDRRAFGMTRMQGLVGDRVKVRVEGVAVAR